MSAAEMTIPVSDLARIVKVAAIASSKNAAAPNVIRGVELTYRAGYLIATATDRYIVLKARAKAQTHGTAEWVPALIQPAAIRALSAMKGKGEAHLILEDDTLTVKVYGASAVPPLVTELDDQKFPNIDRLWPELGDNHAGMVCYSPYMLGQLSKASVAAGKTLLVKFTVPEQSNRPARVSIGDDVIGLILPCRTDDVPPSDPATWI